MSTPESGADHPVAVAQAATVPVAEIDPEDRAPREQWGRTLRGADLAAGAVIALVAVGVALVYRSALVPTDPWHYVQGALDFPDGTWRPAGLSRWGFLLPIIPFARLWGDAPATYYVLPLLSTGVLAAVLYLLGTRYVARTAGVLAAVFALGTPLVFVNLTRGYTDLTATTLVGLALLLATLASDAAHRARDAGRGWDWRVAALLVSCGFVTGWSFEVRETAIFAWPVIGWVLWRIGRPWVTLAWFAPPALAWLVLDIALCALVYDDPWLKFRILLGADISASEVSSDAGYVGQGRGWYMTILPRSILAVSGGPALLACLIVGAIGGLVFRRQLGLVWAWGMLTVGLLWAQGGALDPGHPSVRLDVARYWLSFIVPLMLAAVGTVVIVVRRTQWPVRFIALLGGLALALGVAVPAVQFATTYPGFAPNGGDAMAELRTDLAAQGLPPDARIWADWGTQRVLPAYQRGPFGDLRWEAAKFRSLNRLLKDPPSAAGGYPQPGDYVVIYSADDRTCWHCRRALVPVAAAFGPFPAAGWQQVFVSPTGNLVLYRLGPTAVWPVPEGVLVPASDPLGAVEGSGAEEGSWADEGSGAEEGSGADVSGDLGL